MSRIEPDLSSTIIRSGGTFTRLKFFTPQVDPSVGPAAPPAPAVPASSRPTPIPGTPPVPGPAVPPPLPPPLPPSAADFIPDALQASPLRNITPQDHPT